MVATVGEIEIKQGAKFTAVAEIETPVIAFEITAAALLNRAGAAMFFPVNSMLYFPKRSLSSWMRAVSLAFPKVATSAISFSYCCPPLLKSFTSLSSTRSSSGSTSGSRVLLTFVSKAAPKGLKPRGSASSSLV